MRRRGSDIGARAQTNARSSSSAAPPHVPLLQNPSESIIFSEHKCAVSAAVFSPSGYWVASGDVEGNVIIWSYPQLKVKNTFQIAKSISDLDWDADSTRIVAAGDGAQKARVFSWDSGNNLGEITMHSHPVISCSYRKIRPFRIATGSEDLTVNIYEGPPFKYAASYKGHARYPNGVRYSPDGAFFASVGADSKVVIYDGSTGAVVRETDEKTPEGHKGAIYAFSWSPDSKQLLTASADKTAKIWDAATLAVAQTFTFGTDILDQQVGALWAGEHLLTVSLSGAVNYLDLANTAQPKRILHGHLTSIQSLALDAKSGAFYTAGLTGEVCRWSLATGDGKWLTGKGHGGKVVALLVLNKDASSLLSFGLDDKVRVNATASGAFTSDAGDLGGLPVAAAASPVDAAVSVVVLAQEKLVLLRSNSAVTTLGLGYTPTSVIGKGHGVMPVENQS
jgi:WD40 repeat protein